MPRLGAVTVAALTLLPVAALAQTQAWEGDPVHTHIGFSVRHMMVSNVKGEFAKYSIKVQADPKDPTKSTVDVTIDVASINTGNAQRDGHLKSPDFFDAAKYPSITFKSKKIVKTGKDSFKVTGDLTIKGKTKEIALAVKNFVGPIKDPTGTMRSGFEASAKIDRRDYGVSFNKALEGGGVIVGNEVGISLEVELTQSKK
jgi:polyisoprenoid-binding protein YceI